MWWFTNITSLFQCFLSRHIFLFVYPEVVAGLFPSLPWCSIGRHLFFLVTVTYIYIGTLACPENWGAQSNFPTRDHQNISNLILIWSYMYSDEIYIYIYHWRRKWGGGGERGHVPPRFWLGGNGMFVPPTPHPPTFNPTFLFSTWIICLYNTDN